VFLAAIDGSNFSCGMGFGTRGGLHEEFAAIRLVRVCTGFARDVPGRSTIYDSAFNFTTGSKPEPVRPSISVLAAGRNFRVRDPAAETD
jgi:hypothetical protein